MNPWPSGQGFFHAGAELDIERSSGYDHHMIFALITASVALALAFMAMGLAVNPRT